MRETDPAEQIADALSRLRWRGGRAAAAGHEGAEARGRGPGGHEDHRRRHPGSGGPALMRLLAVLAGADGALSVSDIAEAVGVDQPRASRLVAQAVGFGFVRREADPADARRTRIALTEQGEARVRLIRGARGEAVREALAGFTDQEREQLAALLGRLVEAWPQNVGGHR